MGFSRQEYQSGLPCPPPGDRPNLRMEPASLMSFAFAGRFFTTNHPRSVQFSSVTQLCLTLCHPMDCSTPGFPVHYQLQKPTQTHFHHVGDAIQSFYPLWSPFPPIFNLSQHQGLFQWVSFRIKWPKYWYFSFSISPSNEYSGLISFRIDWFGLLAVQGALKSLLQHHSSKASINSSTLSLLYGPTLRTLHDYWKNHSFD